ncbi:hypothetical protein [Dyella sp.]|uniref:hypothetical protein n=1 Tax=Dyella sp. TaxID=1869338 RepID=UPI0028463CE3|nr:hypothetical protein [Dyella sp.]MDR3444684.1 hypothetical protein [Dyella sp.]
MNMVVVTILASTVLGLSVGLAVASYVRRRLFRTGLRYRRNAMQLASDVLIDESAPEIVKRYALFLHTMASTYSWTKKLQATAERLRKDPKAERPPSPLSEVDPKWRKPLEEATNNIARALVLLDRTVSVVARLEMTIEKTATKVVAKEKPATKREVVAIEYMASERARARPELCAA